MNAHKEFFTACSLGNIMGAPKSGLRTENRSFEKGQFWGPKNPPNLTPNLGVFGSTDRRYPGNRGTDPAPFPTVYSGAGVLEPGKVVQDTMEPRPIWKLQDIAN